MDEMCAFVRFKSFEKGKEIQMTAAFCLFSFGWLHFYYSTIITSQNVHIFYFLTPKTMSPML
uniref:Uncharacterized protein n=1 Tax=Octopus bimaculoides TaxID=37653 RepID=A0A0L8GMP1_OCTBM